MRGSTERLATILAPAIAALNPPAEMKRKRRVDAAITDEGKASDHALSGSLGHFAASWYLSGTLATGNNLSSEYRVPADGVLERFDCRVKTAPTGADLKARLRLAGTAIATVVIAAGTTTGGVPVNQAVSAGDVLTIDVTQVGATVAGANLSAAATIREERRS